MNHPLVGHRRGGLLVEDPRRIKADVVEAELIRQNIAIVVGINLAALGLATAGGLGPVSAAVIHNGSTIVAGTNGLRPLAQGGTAGARRGQAAWRRGDHG